MIDENGKFIEIKDGVIYSNKELLKGLHVKLDEMNKKLEKGAIRFTKIERDMKWHFRAISGLYATLGVLVIKPVRSFLEKIGGLL